MDITRALQRAVRGYPHGTKALAAALDCSETTLNHKVSPTYAQAHCSPEEAADIMEVTGDHSALFALADRLHYVMLPRPEACEGDGPVATVLAAVIADFGRLVTEAAQDLADCTVSDNELARMQGEGARAQAAIQALLGLAARMNASSRPVQLPRVA